MVKRSVEMGIGCRSGSPESPQRVGALLMASESWAEAGRQLQIPRRSARCPAQIERDGARSAGGSCRKRPALEQHVAADGCRGASGSG